MHNIFKSAAVLAVSVFAFASCAQVEEDMGGAVGYLCAPALDVDVTVEDLIETKALQGLISQPDLNEFHYIVKDKDGVEKYNGVGLWEPLAMPVGAYSVEASLGDNGFGEPSFYGKTGADAVINSMEQEVPEMTVQVRNSLVKVGVDTEFAKHFTLQTVTLKSEGRDPVTLSDSEISDWYFVPSGSALEITLTGTSSAGVSKSFTQTINPAARSAYNVICRQDGNNVPGINLPDQSTGAWATRLYITPATFTNISADNQAKMVYELIPEGGDWASAQVAEQIEGQYYVVKGLTNGARYTVRARIGSLFSGEQTVTVSDNLPGTTVSLVHNNNDDPNVVLSGTNATLDLKLTGILKTLNDAGYLQFTSLALTNGVDVTVRTAAASGVMSVVDGWPYLPQGSDYDLVIGHKLSSDQSSVTSVISGFSSPAPAFKLDLTSYSTYDKYLAYKATADVEALEKANSMNAYTIEGMGVAWGISSDLISNSNYSKSLTYQGASVPETSIVGTAYSTADVTGLAVGTDYGVSAKMVFDGVEVSVSKSHHITGLPYYINITSANPEGWTLQNTGFENGRVYLQANRTDSSRGYAISPKYSIPGNIDVSYTVVGYFYCSLVNVSAPKIWVEPTANTSTKSQIGEGHAMNKGNVAYPVTHEGNPYSGTATLTTDKPYMSVSQNCSAAVGQSRRVYFYSLDLKYR